MIFLLHSAQIIHSLCFNFSQNSRKLQFAFFIFVVLSEHNIAHEIISPSHDILSCLINR